MFNILHVERTFTRPQWRELYRIMRKVGDRGSIVEESWLTQRADLARTIRDNIVANQIAVVQSGMDCDSVQYCWSSIVDNPTVMKLWSDAASTYEWADGPCHIGYCRPDERPDNYQRDLAMEAYENGHPHFITTAI
jgi:hypothetical protein